ncbi:hypothetical protein PPL_12626 [Heterostelium album PN500]|uniref:Uncharacterized protein n=1 Tax=Heterostelium pallidum (strain ATCC 26659 / Pp 5 / PN500) TaxID=670386 RepID=D3BN48_HETP5|nr:hypothetical protein PPL_12626 [Heterostelium album PN500]EFA77410.1 hypothetical protein PPL_12626 [Heterostelium album PN500]|eukprot:XP_020429539.1 hypothetical protein PPL_12626 [Heterostelium album PN500]
MLSLPHIILKNIINNIEDNSDRICFVLSCKTLFSHRDKYLIFSVDTANVYHSKEYYHQHKYSLHSFSEQIIQSLNLSAPSLSQLSIILGKDNEQPTNFIVNSLDPSTGKIPNIPRDVLNLTFGAKFNYYIPPRTIPESLVSLQFGFTFNQDITGTLPSSITNLTFGWYFDCELQPHTLPSNLKNLTFGFHFNRFLVTLSIRRSKPMCCHRS